MKPISSSQKKKIVKQLNDKFGISKIPHLLLQFGKEKIRFYSGSLSKDELIRLDKNIRIENIGLYALKNEKEITRLTLDGTQLLKNQISKNILEINESQAKDWMQGNDLSFKLDRELKIIRYDNEFLGSGKSTGERITNFVPKKRRIRN
jgi:NOL1/NOP2/fmu family ribosome biogenesis protein